MAVIPGYKTVSYRVVYIDGKEVSRTLENNSSYKRVDKVILQWACACSGTHTGTDTRAHARADAGAYYADGTNTNPQ